MEEGAGDEHGACRAGLGDRRRLGFASSDVELAENLDSLGTVRKWKGSLERAEAVLENTGGLSGKVGLSGRGGVKDEGEKGENEAEDQGRGRLLLDEGLDEIKDPRLERDGLALGICGEKRRARLSARF